jgi:hypothetical protein
MRRRRRRLHGILGDNNPTYDMSDLLFAPSAPSGTFDMSQTVVDPQLFAVASLPGAQFPLDSNVASASLSPMPVPAASASPDLVTQAITALQTGQQLPLQTTPNPSLYPTGELPAPPSWWQQNGTMVLIAGGVSLGLLVLLGKGKR